jgi:zinc-binding alcohol dehydrogenase/oxidoreductase
MQAVVLPAVKTPASIQSTPEPTAQPGQALVRLKAAALNHRDLFIRQGLYAGLKFPLIPGSDGAGMVESVGSPADQGWVGREVIINPALDWGNDPRAQGPQFRILGLPDSGTFAEKIAIGIHQLAPKPAHLDWHQAAALPLAGVTAWRALFTRAQLKAGEKVLITGIGGGAALFALQYARAAGAEVWVTSSSADKIARAKSLGAISGVNYREADWAKTLQAAAGGLFDVIIDSAGGDGFLSLIELTKPGGRLVFFGATVGNPSGFDLRRGFFRQINILGTTMGSPQDFAGMMDFVARHQITPVIDRVFPLGETEQAFRHMEAAAQFGKIVLSVGGSPAVE